MDSMIGVGCTIYTVTLRDEGVAGFIDVFSRPDDDEDG
jgi:hypothetical protein